MPFDLRSLDFDNIRNALKRFSCTPYGADSASMLAPAPSIDVARTMQTSVTVARHCLDHKIDLLLGEVPDIRVALRQAAPSGSTLNARAIRHVFQVLRAGEELRRLIDLHCDLYPASMPPVLVCETLMATISRTVNDAGRLRDDASDLLLQQNAELAALRDQVERDIKAFCLDPGIKPFVASGYKTLWQGVRAVIAVKTPHLDKVKGVIKGSQAGGLEQLVEPLVCMAANNAMERLTQQIDCEQRRILRELTDKIRENIPGLNVILDAISWVDMAFSAGKLSEQMNAHAPVLVDAPYIELVQAYHPMLILQFLQGKLDAPVPLSLCLDKERRYILITGPNTGGKTVALKTVGLLQLMAQCGLHIPAEKNCTFGWFDTIMVDMGDKQSMYHQLSTFAGHVEVMKEVLVHAGERSLFLLDELGTGTDPEEGAALAMAMIDELVKRKSLGIVNTHLAPLKSYAEHKQCVSNAAMLFDEKTLSPTYQLKTGVNGGSFGLVIAERNGLPVNIIRTANRYLSDIRER